MNSLSDRLEEMTIAHFDHKYGGKNKEKPIFVVLAGKDKKKIEVKVRKLTKNGNFGAAMKIANPELFNKIKADLSGNSFM